jgi:Protein of unknown function (DUF2892)
MAMNLTANVGTVDRILRIIVGLGLLSMLLWVDGNAKWWGLIGLGPLLTAFIRWCPAYAVIGANTGAK